MLSKVIIKELNDWSKIDKDDPFYYGIDMSRSENFGIHPFNNDFWTSGFVGVGRLYGSDSRVLKTQGKDHVVVINSQYGMDPWKMLEKVMTDPEYEDYIKELTNQGKYLFRVFYDQPVIKLNQNQACDADVLYALSFINACFRLCKSGIKKQMIQHEENFCSKIRGKIDVKKNIRINTVKGRNDRFYCKYIDFTIDTIENRILKATLVKCKKIIEQKFCMKTEMLSQVYYCLNALRSVKLVNIKDSDFNDVVVTGLYTYYKPLMVQARGILSQKFRSYIAEDGNSISHSVFTIPYMINMETLFEFYVRSVFKETIDLTKYYVEDYSKRVFLEQGINNSADVLHGIHLMSYCIPDIIISDNITRNPVCIFDAKYKANDESSRDDSHQLLSYVLLSGVKKCGFIFPGKVTSLKSMRNTDCIEIKNEFSAIIKYYEIVLGNTINPAVISQVIS